ncbi:hypothetical protein SteCoe_4240 [Stentor coeruleus]|uniref:VWFA domain-containing protein n=1 Tax=Stentor coeruleus TaxID=5963 RepID=A0A1R2CV75_9CILI|nr:hypothetical protein SteCoe_4240 [Stentor coeruleus]
MSTDKVPAELIHIIGEIIALRFDLPKISEVESDSIDGSLYAMFAIDRSGSMSGSPIDDAKGAAESLVNKFRNLSIPVSVYPFNSSCEEYSSDTEGYDHIIEQIQSIKANGGTVFAKVIKAMGQRIKEKNLKSVFIVWLTDGKNNQKWDTFKPIIDEHKSFNELNGINATVHCIGFSSRHDASLLTSLAQSGTRPGTFQYVPEGGRIPIAVNNVFNLASSNAQWAKLLSGENTYHILTENEGGNVKALAYISENDLENCKVQVHMWENVKIYDIIATRADTRNIVDIVHLVTAFIGMKIMTALDKGCDGALEKLIGLIEMINEAERRLNELLEDTKSLRIFQRMQIMPFFKATFDIINGYNKIVQSKILNNTEYANLNSMANGLFLKRNLEKKIAKETGENVRMMIEADEKVAEVIKGVEVKEIEEKYAGFMDLGNLKCALSSKTWIELLANGDCLCATFHVERPQNLVGNPNDIKFKQVNSFFVSHDNFLTSKLFETKAGQIIQGERSYSHGLAPTKANILIPGLPSESVNGILPLFINKDHWKISNLRINQMLGYITTVDVLGFKNDQLIVLPFLAYTQALLQKNDLLTKLLRETCDQIYKENKDKILPKLFEILEIYHKNPIFRTEIKSNSLVLAWLTSAVRCKDIIEYNHIFIYILEEEVRRYFPLDGDMKIIDYALKIFDIDIDPYLEQAKASFATPEISYAKVFTNAKNKFLFSSEETKCVNSEEKNIENNEKHAVTTVISDLSAQEQEEKRIYIQQKEEEQMKLKSEQIILEETYKPQKRLETLNKTAYTTIDNINTALLPNGLLYKLSVLFSELGFSIKTLHELLPEPEQKLSFLLQSLGNKKDRKEIYEEHLYSNSYSYEDSLIFVQTIYGKSIAKKVMAYKSKHLSGFSVSEGKKKAEIFASTNDIEEAAGCVYGLKQGDKAFPYFFKSIEVPNIPLVYEKLKMLTLGHYQGIKLIFDNMAGSKEFILWRLSNKKAYTMWIIYKDFITKEQWQEAFPLKINYFEHLYIRQNGDFVPYSHPRKNVQDPRHWEGKIKSEASKSQKNLALKIETIKSTAKNNKKPSQKKIIVKESSEKPKETQIVNKNPIQSNLVGNASTISNQYLVIGYDEVTITTVISLFINDPKWKKHKTELLNSKIFNPTKPTRTLTEEELLTIPFAMYSNAFRYFSSKIILNIVADTCFKIYRSKRDTIKSMITEFVEKKMKDPLKIVCYTDTNLMLSRLSSAIRFGDFTNFKEILALSVFDQFKEMHKNIYNADILKVAKKVLIVQTEGLEEKLRMRIKRKEVSYLDIFSKAKNKENISGDFIDMPDEDEEIVFSSRIPELSPYAEKICQRMNKSFGKNKYIGKRLTLLNSFGSKIKTLDDLGLLENEQKLAFIIQAHGFGLKNSEYRKQKLYTEGFTPNECIEYIQKIMSTLLKEQYNKIKNKILDEILLSHNKDAANIFATTSNLEEAAGCIYGLTQGSSMFPLYFQALHTPGIPHIFEKIKMLTFGHYNSIGLISDEKNNSSEFITWEPSKKRVHKLWIIHKDEGGIEKWQEVFPHLKEYFEHFYLRLDKNFVPYTKPRKNVKDSRHWEGKSMKRMSRIKKNGKRNAYRKKKALLWKKILKTKKMKEEKEAKGK